MGCLNVQQVCFSDEYFREYNSLQERTIALPCSATLYSLEDAHHDLRGFFGGLPVSVLSIPAILKLLIPRFFT